MAPLRDESQICVSKIREKGDWGVRLASAAVGARGGLGRAGHVVSEVGTGGNVLG